MSETIEQIYTISEKLQSLAGADYSSETASFQFLLDAVKGDAVDTKVKVLCAGLIPQYAGSFPELAKVSVDTQLDMCEDDQVTVRVAAIRGLAKLVESLKDTSDVERVIDAIIQLLLTVEDKNEEVALNHVFKILVLSHGLITFKCITTQYQAQTEEAARAKLRAIIDDDFIPKAANFKKVVGEIKSELSTLIQAFLASAALSTTEYAYFMRLLEVYLPQHGKAIIESFPIYANLLLSKADLTTDIPSVEADVQTQLSNTLSSVRQFEAIARRLSKVNENKGIPSITNIFTFFFDKLTPFVISKAEGSDLPVVSQLTIHIAKLVELLTPRQGNSIFPAVIANLKTLLSEDAPNRAALTAYLLMASHLASYLPDQVHELTGLPVKTVQPTVASADVIQARLTEFLSKLNKQKEAIAQTKVTLNEEVVEINRRLRVSEDVKRKLAHAEKTAAANLAKLRATTIAAAKGLGKSETEAAAMADEAVARFQESAAKETPKVEEPVAEEPAVAEEAAEDSDKPKRAPAVPYTEEEHPIASARRVAINQELAALKPIVFLLDNFTKTPVVFVTVTEFKNFENHRGQTNARDGSAKKPETNGRGNQGGRGGDKKDNKGGRPQQGQQQQQQRGGRPDLDVNRKRKDRNESKPDFNKRPRGGDNRENRDSSPSRGGDRRRDDRQGGDRRPQQGGDRRRDDRQGGDRRPQQGGDRRRDDRQGGDRRPQQGGDRREGGRNNNGPFRKPSRK